MKRVWHKGPPPHIGWWNASLGRSCDAWRWWDGTKWSISATPSMSSWQAAAKSEYKSNGEVQRQIEWTDYWPENARVERKAP